MQRIGSQLVGLATALTTVLVLASVAQANPRINVQLFRPSPHPSDMFTVVTSDVHPNAYWTASAMLHFGKNPLVFIESQNNRRHELIQDQLTLDLMGSYSLYQWVDVGIALPVHFINSGQDAGFVTHDEISEPALGDLRFTAKVRIINRGEEEDGIGLAGDVLLVLPTGEPDSFVSDGFSFQPALIFDVLFSGFRAAVNVGGRFRSEEKVVVSNTTFLTVHHEFFWRLGASYPILGERDSAVYTKGIEVSAIGELYGSTSGDINNTSVEGVIGGRLRLPDYGVRIDLGGGSGMVKGYGNTKFRLFIGGGYFPPIERDTDEDGFLDEADKCPTEAEDVDEFEDDDGCPEPDNDEDFVLDGIDRCPNDAEDKDGFEDADGCPDPDNDGDGIVDASDKCPNEAEDKDGFEDEDGCEEADNDNDGIKDAADQCPNDPETINGWQDDDGCPDQSLARVDKDQIVIMDKVYFDTGMATIKAQSFPVLQAVAGVLKTMPQIGKLSVEGHTDDQGKNKDNLQLSQDRAQAVVEFLVREGIDRTRLTAVGHGEDMPVVEGKDDAARAANRRVEFLIIEQ